MGLDMYLYRTKRVKGLSEKDYVEIENSLPYDGYDKEEGLGPLNPGIPFAAFLNESVKSRGSESFQWLSIFEEVGYWRKANQIHAWFVERCQDGVDECQLTEVTKEQPSLLVSSCRMVLDNPDLGESMLPTQSGFFFGGTEYDKHYIKGLKNTIEIIEKVIETTDFETQIVFYQSSW